MYDDNSHLVENSNLIFHINDYKAHLSSLPSQFDKLFLAYLSRRLRGELIVYRSSRRPSVRPCMRLFTLSNMNISATSRPIGMKFYLKHYWGEGKASVGFDLDRIRTLISMATDSSHRVIIGKTASSRFLQCF